MDVLSNLFSLKQHTGSTLTKSSMWLCLDAYFRRMATGIASEMLLKMTTGEEMIDNGDDAQQTMSIIKFLVSFA